MNINKLILEEIYKMEGVGDKYAASKFGIPDEGIEFEKNYRNFLAAQNPEKTNMGKFVGSIFDVVHGKRTILSNVYLNPINLNNFDKDVRALTDREGNLFIAQHAGDFFHKHMGFTVNTQSEYDIGDAYNERENIQWHRINNTNIFGYSISFSDRAQDERFIDDVTQRIEAAKRKTGFDFRNEYWLNLKDEL